MNPERWREVREVLQLALEREPAERARFLAERCAGDAELRREVESLIAADESDDDFLEAPAYEYAAAVLTTGAAGALTGQTLGRYRVVSLLGAGGMGEVYLAEDVELGRRVALKILPSFLTADAAQIARFRREARAASALNHPGIVTVYEMGEDCGLHFIAAEYVEGETLRARLSGARLTAGEAVDIAIKAAEALDAAHRAGVVHRDVKPENLMLRPDGYVKVLDFGLAKLTGARAHLGGERGQAVSAADTRPGVVMGTVAYMSPEQARGEEVDARTDVWSLGVVLYELLAGRAPFVGQTPSHCVVSIIEEEPPPLSASAAGVPEGLRRVVSRALRKDKAERQQTAGELADELKSVRHELGGRADTAGRGLISTGGLAQNRITASVRPPRAAKVIAAVLALAVAGAVFALLKIFGEGGRRAAAAPFRSVGLTRLTNDGEVRTAALSPDGNYAAYALAGSGGQSLWVKHVASSSAAQIMPPAPVQYHGLSFTPDGGYLYALASDGSRGDMSLSRVPVLGGSLSRLAVVSDTPVSFSPDGRRFAFVEVFSTRGESVLYVAGADGTGRRQVAVLRQPDFFAAYPGGPAWSPDGSAVAAPAGLSDAEGHYMGVAVVNPEGGEVRTVGARRWASISHVAWLAGGRGLVLTARDNAASPRQVWHLTYPGGEARQVTNDLNDYSFVSATADAGALAAIQANVVSSVWVLPGGDAARAERVASEVGEIGVISWAAGGRIAYRSNDYRAAYVGLMGADGSGLRRVAFDARIKEGLSVSPDGRHLVFASDRAGRYNLWRADVETGDVTRLTSGDGEVLPSYTPDGRWIVYQRGYGLVKPTIWKMPGAGGDPVPLTETHAAMPSVSPDGRFVACSSLQEVGGEKKWRVLILPIEGGPPVRVLDIGVVGARLLRWTPGGRSLAFVHDQQGASNVWVMPLDGGPARPVTQFKDGKVQSFDWAQDGGALLIARGAETQDVVLIRDLK